jgi:hypothetical protein
MSATHCDRCGIKAGSHPKGWKYSAITIEPMSIAGKVWQLCSRCRQALRVYK